MQITKQTQSRVFFLRLPTQLPIPIGALILCEIRMKPVNFRVASCFACTELIGRFDFVAAATAAATAAALGETRRLSINSAQ